MPHKNPEEHAAYNKQWLYDPDHPERLEKKKAKDRERYRKNRDKILKRSKERYRDNPDKYKARVAAYREEAAQIILEARQQPCADCGGDFPPCCMQFHHLDPSTKLGEVRSMGHPTRVKREMEKCIVICANCHCIRHGE